MKVIISVGNFIVKSFQHQLVWTALNLWNSSASQSCIKQSIFVTFFLLLYFSNGQPLDEHFPEGGAVVKAATFTVVPLPQLIQPLA